MLSNYILFLKAVNPKKGLSQLNKAPTTKKKEAVPNMGQSSGLIDEREYIWDN